jgi:hypothetical protein
MSEIVWFILVVLGGVGAVIWAESIPTDREIILKDVRYQVRIRQED